MSFPARITGVKSNKDGRRDSIIGARKIPNAKKPNSRPPARLRDKVGFLYGTLPNYSGPYVYELLTTTIRLSGFKADISRLELWISKYPWRNPMCFLIPVATDIIFCS